MDFIAEKINTVSIQSTHFTPSESNRSVASHSAYLSSGQIQGQSVAITSHLAKLQTVAEEVAFSISEKMEKNLAKRKAGQEKDVKNKAIEAAEKYLKKVHNVEKLQNFVKDLNQQTFYNARLMLQFVQQYSRDPTEQYLALAYAASLLQQDKGRKKTVEDTRNKQADALDEAISLLMDEQGAAVHAGLNIEPATTDFASQGMGDVEQLRGFYRDTVLDYKGVKQTYQHIIQEYGEDEFVQTLKFLLRALSADFSASGSSIEKPKLQAIINDMYVLKLLSGMYEQCSDLLKKMQDRFKQAAGYNGQHLISKMLDLKEELLLRAEQVEDITDQLSIQGIEHKIYFLREFKELLRLIPEKAYENLTRRDKLLSAAQEALDHLIKVEDGLSNDYG